VAKKKKRGCLPRILIFFIIIVVAIFGWRMFHEYQYPLKYEAYIYQYSAENEVDPYLVMGMIRTESNFIQDAVSHQNAKGLMQIMDDTAYWIANKMGIENFTINDLNDPETNIKMGTWYISWLLDKFNQNEKTALAAYNGGMGNVNKWLSDDRYSADGKNLVYIPYKETSKYVEKVLRYQANYEKIYKEK